MIDDMEVIVFKIITASGIAKGLAYKALDKVENRDFKGAYKLLGEANEYIDEAHEIQKGIIEDEVTGNAIEISTLSNALYANPFAIPDAVITLNTMTSMSSIIQIPLLQQSLYSIYIFRVFFLLSLF